MRLNICRIRQPLTLARIEQPQGEMQQELHKMIVVWNAFARDHAIFG